MSGDDLAVVIVVVTFILTTGGVILLRPFARRLGEFLDVLIQEKRSSAATPRARVDFPPPLEQIEERLSLVEERVHFTEALLSSPGAQSPDRASTQRVPVADKARQESGPPETSPHERTQV